MLKMKNKRAQIPEAFIFISMMLVAGYSLYIVYQFNADFANRVTVPTELSDIYGNQDRFEIFAEQSGALSVVGAFAEISKVNSNCPSLAPGLIPIWDSGCGPVKNKINEAFAKEIDSRFKALLKSDRNYKISIGGENIIFEFENYAVNFTGKGYNGTYSYRTKFSLENPLKEDFETIYKKALQRENDCRNENSMSLDKCMGKLALNDWKASCSASGQYTVCTLSTNKYYSYGNSLSRVESKFALKN